MAVMSIFNPVRISVVFDHENADIITSSSPIRLMDGGSAKFVRLARIHHVAIKGRSVCSPRVRIIVRLCTRS